MKVIDGYAYIGSEADGHGLQIFDMRKVYGSLHHPNNNRLRCFTALDFEKAKSF